MNFWTALRFPDTTSTKYNPAAKEGDIQSSTSKGSYIPTKRIKIRTTSISKSDWIFKVCTTGLRLDLKKQPGNSSTFS